MEKQAMELAASPVVTDSQKRNRGWFQPGDRRINRGGPPRNAGLGSPSSGLPFGGKLKSVFVGHDDLGRYLKGYLAGWISGLPRDFRIVASVADSKLGGVTLVLHSDTFEPMLPGDDIPELNDAP